MSLWLPDTITSPRPSFAAGWAHRAALSTRPGRWKGLVGTWVPLLGRTGLTLRDVSGRKNHGTLTNMDPATDWVASEMGPALDLDGGNDYINLGGAGGELDLPGTAWTIHILVRRVGGQVNYSKMFGKGVFNTGYVFGVGDIADELTFSSSGGTVGPITWTSPNEWTHFHITNDPGASRIYENSVQGASGASITAVAVAQPLVLGADYGGAPARHFACQIASFGLWHHRSLASSEIADCYANPLGMFRLRRRTQVGVAGAPVAGKPTMYYQQMSMGAA